MAQLVSNKWRDRIHISHVLASTVTCHLFCFCRYFKLRGCLPGGFLPSLLLLHNSSLNGVITRKTGIEGRYLHGIGFLIEPLTFHMEGGPGLGKGRKQKHRSAGETTLEPSALQLPWWGSNRYTPCH